MHLPCPGSLLEDINYAQHVRNSGPSSPKIPSIHTVAVTDYTAIFVGRKHLQQWPRTLSRTINATSIVSSAAHPDHWLEGKHWDSVDDFEHIFERYRVHVASPSDGVARSRGQQGRYIVATNGDDVRII